MQFPTGAWPWATISPTSYSQLPADTAGPICYGWRGPKPNLQGRQLHDNLGIFQWDYQSHNRSCFFLLVKKQIMEALTSCLFIVTIAIVYDQGSSHRAMSCHVNNLDPAHRNSHLYLPELQNTTHINDSLNMSSAGCQHRNYFPSLQAASQLTPFHSGDFMVFCRYACSWWARQDYADGSSAYRGCETQRYTSRSWKHLIARHPTSVQQFLSDLSVKH